MLRTGSLKSIFEGAAGAIPLATPLTLMSSADRLLHEREVKLMVIREM